MSCPVLHLHLHRTAEKKEIRERQRRRTAQSSHRLPCPIGLIFAGVVRSFGASERRLKTVKTKNTEMFTLLLSVDTTSIDYTSTACTEQTNAPRVSLKTHHHHNNKKTAPKNDRPRPRALPRMTGGVQCQNKYQVTHTRGVCTPHPAAPFR